MTESSLDVVETVRQLVRTPSVNPMGRDIKGDIFYESRLTDQLRQLFDRLGLPQEVHPVEPLRGNILTAIGDLSDPQCPLVLWEVHQDTVPIDFMTIDPFAAELRDGRIYGRGACDIKGGMGCMLTALSRMMRKSLSIKLVLACTVNEEHGFTGALGLTQLYHSGQSQLLDRRPDAIIVAEPTELDVVVAHKGSIRWILETVGVAGHSSQPRHDHNAIYHMAQVVTCLEDYASRIVATRSAHPLLTEPTLSVGTIEGGLSVNTVPPAAHIAIDRRLLPGEEPQSARQHVIDYLNQHCSRADKIKHHPPMISAAALSNDHNSDLADRVCRMAAIHAVESKTIGVSLRHRCGDTC